MTKSPGLCDSSFECHAEVNWKQSEPDAGRARVARSRASSNTKCLQDKFVRTEVKGYEKDYGTQEQQ
jgi:hypothetical protein